ncbi:Vir protein [Legionella pneumophila serogroup 1]
MNTQTTSSHCKTSATVSKRIELLFTRFAVYYGHIWKSLFKSESFINFAKQEWEKALSQFSDEVLEKAIIGCRDFCEMPPTLPQMMQFCRDVKKRAEVFKPTEVKKPAEYEVVKSHIKQCYQFLSTHNKEREIC